MTADTPFADDLRTIAVLVRRDVQLFVRQTSRLVGALLQPVLFWVVIGSGLSPTFSLPGTTLGYRTYFFPGVVLMIVLFTGIFATMSVIEDRREGFLQGVLAGPGSRLALVLGKCLGGTSIALIQVALFLLLAPLAGFPWGTISWWLLFAILLLAGMALSACGFALAWVVSSTQGYHVVMNLLLVPLWVVSGAMFPPAGLPPAFAAVVAWNPMSWAVSGVRRALHGGALPPGTSPNGGGPFPELAVGLASAAVLVALAAAVARRRPASA